MKLRRMIGLLLCLSILALLVCGCGNAPSSNKVMSPAAPMEATMAAYDSEIAYEEAADMMAAAGSSSITTLPQNRKFIITMNMDTETENLDSALEALSAKIAGLSGYIEDQSVYNGSTYASYRRYRSASLTVRIPVTALDTFTAEVKALANVVSTSQSTQDVTLQYVDTESRITALKTEQTRLLELLAQAEDMADLLVIEQRLTEVRYQLEQYGSQMRVLDNQIDYATIYLSLSEVQEYTPVEEVSLWRRIADGFKSTLKDIGEGAEDLFVWLIVDLPYFVIIGAVVWVLSVPGRKLLAKAKAKKAARKQKKEKGE